MGFSARFLFWLCAGVASLAGSLMAPVDHSTRLKDLGGRRSYFHAPHKQYCLLHNSYTGREFGLTNGKQEFGPEDHPLCGRFQDRRDSLTIDDVFEALNDLPPGTEGTCYHLETDLEGAASLSSRLVEYVRFFGSYKKEDPSAPLITHHALSAMSVPHLEKLDLGCCPVVDCPAALKGVELSADNALLSIREPYYGRLGPYAGKPRMPRLMCRGLEEKGWYDIQNNHHAQYAAKHFLACFGAGCFAPENNPLKIVNVAPFGIQGVDEVKDVEPCGGGKVCEAGPVPEARSHIADVRPEIADFGIWLNTVTRAVNAVLSRAWILPDAAGERLAMSLQDRLENATQAEKDAHKDTLKALVTAVPALAPVVMLPKEEGETPSPLTIPSMPPEMWREIFDFLSPQDQAHTIVAYPPLFQNLAFLASVFPELRTHLPHRIPLALGGGRVVTNIGENCVDILDASPWHLNRIRTLENNIPLNKLSLPRDPITLPSLTLEKLYSHPLTPVEITAEITFKAKRRAGEHEGDPTTVMDAFLTLTNTQNSTRTQIGPLTLIKPCVLNSLLPDMYKHPDYQELAGTVLPYLALIELEKGAKEAWQALA